MKQDKGYYDIEIEFDKLLEESGMINDMFYLKDLKQRKLFITCNIDQMSVEDAVKHIMQFNREDCGIPVEERKPILLYIASNGGDVDAGFELIDAIITSKTPVYTINMGYQYSMGFLIGIAGKKRFAMPNAKFLMHDGSNLVYNSGAKMQDQLEFQKKLEGKIKSYILSRTKVTAEKYNEMFRVEWYMFADEAKELGITDCIIGVDCELEEVI